MKQQSDLNFRYELLEEISGRGEPLEYIPDGKPGVGRDGVVVKMCPPVGNSWTGVYAFGDMSPNGKCEVYEGPGRDRLTILAKGEAYIIAADDPKSFEHVNLCPVIEVVPVPNRNLVLLHDYTEISAYSEKGLLWETGRISWDGIEIKKVKDDQIFGLAWDAPNEKFVEFRVNLNNGSYSGGAAPPVA